MKLRLAVLAALCDSSASLRVPTATGRRKVLSLAGAAAFAGRGAAQPASAADPSVKIYFGAGCFWHVQHEFTMEEMSTLKRTSSQITAISGYAGGQRLGDGGKVCYHNFKRFADYGQLGHAEAVQVEVPASAIPAFSRKYFGLFGTRGYRHDPMDKGGEYRSVLGLPGGENSVYYAEIQKAASESPMTLFTGRGDEGDTIGDKSVLVYDSNKFPFYAGELYHQFHDDFMGPPYGKAYNAINPTLYKAGVLKNTGCPDSPF